MIEKICLSISDYIFYISYIYYLYQPQKILWVGVGVVVGVGLVGWLMGLGLVLLKNSRWRGHFSDPGSGKH